MRLVVVICAVAACADPIERVDVDNLPDAEDRCIHQEGPETACATGRTRTGRLEMRDWEIEATASWRYVYVTTRARGDERPHAAYIAWFLDAEGAIVGHLPLVRWWPFESPGGSAQTAVVARRAVRVAISREGPDFVRADLAARNCNLVHRSRHEIHGGFCRAEASGVLSRVQYGVLDALLTPQGPIVAEFHLARTDVATRVPDRALQ